MRGGDEYDLAVVGASFAGLIAATTAAACGLKVALLEAKPRAGARPRTTGILVKEAAEELDFPGQVTRKLRRIRLYSPNLRHVDLAAPGYYFLATDTGALLDWLCQRAEAAGVRVFTGARLRDVRIRDGMVELDPVDMRARFVIGADGARSKVARLFNLGLNTRFLVGVEAHFPLNGGDNDDAMHCFLDSKLAPGYLGWSFAGAGIRQVGLAANRVGAPDLEAFMRKIAPVMGEEPGQAVENLAGVIPCGGLVRPFAHPYALLTGDAAGLVSPLTGGGIHCALRYGRRAALAVSDYLCDGGPHPGVAMASQYPAFRAKQLLRTAMDAHPPNALYDAMLNTKAFLAFARAIFFRSRGGAAQREPQQTWEADAASLFRGPQTF